MGRRINNKTKIIATIGPASDSEEALLKMFKAGVNVCRINASHGDHPTHQKAMDRISKPTIVSNMPISLLFIIESSATNARGQSRQAAKF